MLDIETLIWVIPGMVGLWTYNLKLTIKLPHTEGWTYLLAVVFFAFPYYVFLKYPPEDIINWFFSYFFEILEPMHLNDVWVLVVSSIVSAGLGYVVAHFRNTRNKTTVDTFHDSCTSWLEKLVFITLDNKKIYLGILIDHTRDIRFEYTIKIIPAYSGYRDERGRVHWDFEYPQQPGTIVELIIPQSKIINFVLWNNSSEFKNRPSDSEFI